MPHTMSREELREQIHCLMIDFAKEDGKGYIDRRIEHLNHALALLDTYTEQREREARIDELKKAPVFGTYWLQKFEDGSDTPNEYVKARLKELEQENKCLCKSDGFSVSRTLCPVHGKGEQL